MSFTERLALVISARADEAIRELRRLRGESGDLSDGLGGAGEAASSLGDTLKAGLAAGAAAGAAALAAVAVASIEAASGLQEQVSGTEQVFGDAADAVLDFGETSAKAFGVSNRAALEASNRFGDLFVNVGVSEANAAKFSTQLVRLASDIASFKDLDVDDVLAGLSSGLVGETEPLRNFGIVMNSAAVDAKAMELGIADANGEVSEGAKVQARYALILEKTATAQGDVGRTGDSLANRQRALSAQFEDTRAQLGEKLTPAAADAAAILAKLVDYGGDLGTQLGRGIPVIGLLGKGLDYLAGSGQKTTEQYELLNAETARQQQVTEDATAATEAATEAEKKRADALRGVLAATEDLIGSQLSVADAVDRLRDGQSDSIGKEKALADAIREHGRTSAEAAKAGEELEDARRNELRDIETLVKARRDLAVQQSEAAGQTVTDADKYRIYRDELIKIKDTLAPGSPLRVHLEELINQLPPPEVKFAVVAETETAKAKLEELRGIYKTIAAGPTILGAQPRIRVPGDPDGPGPAAPPSISLRPKPRARGGSLTGLGLVGEEGPELINVGSTPHYVTDANRTAGVLGASSGTPSIVIAEGAVQINVSGEPDAFTRAWLEQYTRDLPRRLVTEISRLQAWEARGA